MNSFKGTFEFVSGTSQGLSKSDWVVIVCAIISLIGVLTSCFFTNRRAKKINEDNNEFQKSFNQVNNQLMEKLNQKNIDANLKAKARIEWIQNVRNTSAELISLYYQLLNSTDKDKLFETFIASQAKAELLILFFGPEVKKQTQEELSNVSITKLENNEGKNDLIVDFLSKLTSDFYAYYSKASENEKGILEQIRKERMSRMYENPIDYIVYEPTFDEDGNEISNIEPIPDPKLEASVKEIDEKIQQHTLFTKNLNDRLIRLRNIMRIYLKIEWNKAKKGE